MLLDALGYSWMLKDSLRCFQIFCDALGCNGMLCDALGCFRKLGGILGCSDFKIDWFQDAFQRPWMLQDALETLQDSQILPNPRREKHQRCHFHHNRFKSSTESKLTGQGQRHQLPSSCGNTAPRPHPPAAATSAAWRPSGTLNHCHQQRRP